MMFAAAMVGVLSLAASRSQTPAWENLFESTDAAGRHSAVWATDSAARSTGGKDGVVRNARSVIPGGARDPGPTGVVEPEAVLGVDAIFGPDGVVEPEAVLDPELLFGPDAVFAHAKARVPAKSRGPEPVLTPDAIFGPEIVFAHATARGPGPAFGPGAPFGLGAVFGPDTIFAPGGAVGPGADSGPDAVFGPEGIFGPEAIFGPDAVFLPDAVLTPCATVYDRPGRPGHAQVVPASAFALASAERDPRTRW